MSNETPHVERSEQHSIDQDLGDLPLEEASALRVLADLLRDTAQGAPPLHEDPVAAMLGLVPDAGFALDASKLRKARVRAHLSVSDLARKLTARGWQVQPRDVFRWEQRSPAEASPALIAAIAAETGTLPERLVSDRSTGPVDAVIASITQSEAFRAIVARWARLQGVSIALASSQLESHMMATAYRGNRVDAEQMLHSLQILVDARADQQQSLGVDDES